MSTIKMCLPFALSAFTVVGCGQGDEASGDADALSGQPGDTAATASDDVVNPLATAMDGAAGGMGMMQPGSADPGMPPMTMPTMEAMDPAPGDSTPMEPAPPADGAGGDADLGAGGSGAGPQAGGTGGGAAAMGGTDGLAPLGGATSVGVEPESDCPPPPDDASPEAIEALNAVNAVRLPAGAGCITMIGELNAAALNHCVYYAQNDGDCTADAHSEVEGCEGYTGSSFGQRANAAGYMGQPSFEVIAFTNDAQRAVDMWLGSVWHQLPIVSPWVTEMGYGNAEGCDTIDFGRGSPLPEDTVVTYPYADQVGVPPSFSGNEGPAPPEPPTGWPSGHPVTLWAQDAEITEHLLTLEGDDSPIDHVWLEPGSPDSQGLLQNEIVMYANDALEPMTRYRVRLVGTYVGGPLNLELVFETGESQGRF